MSTYRRWTRADEDGERLPEGMTRIGYDADTRQYTFLDTTDGTHYVSAPGNRYGTLVPAATADFPKASRTSGRRQTLQAYDRPVFFADEFGIQQQPSMGHKRNPTMPTSSRHHHSNSTSRSDSTRKHGRKRSASFSDFLPPHLIARASNASDVPTVTPTPSKPSSQGARGGGLIKSAPPSPPPPSYGYGEEKIKPAEGWSSPTDPLSSLPTLSPTPPPLPPKDYPPSSPQQHFGATCTPRVAMRFTARVLGRTLGAARDGLRSPKGQSSDDGWVVV